MRRLEANLAKGEVRRASLDGKPHVVVPVIMARGDVVMNATLVPPSEFEAFAWNGVPVTLRHPQSDGGAFDTANKPINVEKYRIGTIYNTKSADGVLRAEAWLDVELTNKKAPGLIANLEAGVEMNVSTGFFSDLEPKSGHLNGRDYEAVHHNIRPDHLALLPDELGACSYEDGCGVRSNIRGAISERLTKMLAAFSAEVAKWSPAVAELDLALRANAAGDGKGAQPEPDEKPKDDETMKPEEIAALAANAAKEAVAAALAVQAEANAKAIKEALATFAADQAKATEAAERPALVAHVVACSAITKEQAEAMDFASLKVVANGLKAKTAEPDFSGRGLPLAVVANASEAEKIAAMQPKGIVAHFAAKKKEAA